MKPLMGDSRSPMKKLLIVQTSTSHDDLPDLCASHGDEVDWFTKACRLEIDQVRVVRVFLGEQLPSPDGICGVIITGSVDMVSDNYKWIETTKSWLYSALSFDVPILGVCFGHQLLATTFGGEVGRNINGAEFGLVSVKNTHHDPCDQLFGGLPDRLEVYTFHYESILRLPKSAVILAHNEHDPYHAVRFAENIWGVQFHPEFDETIMSSSLDVYENEIRQSGIDVTKLRSINHQSNHGTMLLNKFAEIAFA